MSLEEYDSQSQSLSAVIARELVRRPYLMLSMIAHAAVVAVLYYYGSYQPGLREQAEEITSSLSATHMASAAKRLQDLQTIKRQMEKSADLSEGPPEPEPNMASEAMPQSPGEMVDSARKLSDAIEAIDREMRAGELAKLLGTPAPPPAAAETAAVPDPSTSSNAIPPEAGRASVTPEMADNEVAALADKGQAIFASLQRRLAAQSSGIAVEGGVSGKGTGGNADRRASSVGQTHPQAKTELTDFLQPGQSVGNPAFSTPYNGAIQDLSNDATFPTVDPSKLVLGRGRMFGAGGEYANRVFINSWYIIGPFPGRHGDQVFDNPAYPPEKAVLLDAVYMGKDGRRLNWRYVTTQRYPLLPPDPVVDGVYYGYTEVSMDEDCDLVLWIGADDDAQVYVNDQLVWRGGNVNKMQYFNTVFAHGATHTRDYNRSEGKRVVHFNKGPNRIFFKLSNGAQDVFLSIVLTR